ncbi:MAG: hypothetical protein ACI94Y_002524 [Maribacter sp.]|jgi:hypothetical protein
MFISCNGIEKDELSTIKDDLIQFTDIIPINMPDSSKVEIIEQLVSEIDMDISLTHIDIVDSLNPSIHAFYRNDTLVKIVQGNMPLFAIETFCMMRTNYSQYYFHMDSLICAQYKCSRYQQTGRCNPVSIFIHSIVYNSQVIFQEIDDKIGQYYSCGCGFSPSFRLEKEDRTKFNYDTINRLKEKVREAGK